MSCLGFFIHVHKCNVSFLILFLLGFGIKVTLKINQEVNLLIFSERICIRLKLLLSEMFGRALSLFAIEGCPIMWVIVEKGTFTWGIKVV